MVNIVTFCMFAGLIFSGASCFFPREIATAAAVFGGMIVNESFRFFVGR